MTSRVSIQALVDEDQLVALKRLSKRTQRSMSSHVREALDLYFDCIDEPVQDVTDTEGAQP